MCHAMPATKKLKQSFLQVMTDNNNTVITDNNNTTTNKDKNEDKIKKRNKNKPAEEAVVASHPK